ncbi:cysteine-rich secretory protein 3 isoform X2 [Castor canadensis]|uniref:Cysteine-rich secretory protein 3 isoform X2 n=1 Tax=Castor canadensis TaxID=51338 RepID=A0AC58N8T3_CASCN
MKQTLHPTLRNNAMAPFPALLFLVAVLIPSCPAYVYERWSSAASKNAQKWAENCNYAHSMSSFRRTNMSCGENLYMSSHLPTWSNAIQSWYDEVHDFTFGEGPKEPFAIVGHYTQIVWYSSFLIGCGVAYCPENSLKYFMVCHYCPAGNYLNRYYVPYDEGEPCARCPDHCDDGLCTNSCGYEDQYSNCPVLAKTATCNHLVVKAKCQATCKCQGKIY